MDFNQVLDSIENLNTTEIDQVLSAAIKRKVKLYSEWEIVCMAIPKNDREERQKTIQYIIDMLQRE